VVSRPKDDCEAAQAIRLMMHSVGRNWRGTATELLRVLIGHARRNAAKTHRCPKTPIKLSIALRRIVPRLRTTAIAVNYVREGGCSIIANTRINASPGADGTRHGQSKA
jgi:hypothetical protein